VSNARITSLIHERFENFPKPERHGDKTHWYEAVPALQSMIGYLTANTARKHASAARAAAVLNDARAEAPATPEPKEGPAWTPTEIDKLASAATRLFRLEQEKKQFVRADIARHFIRTLFQTVNRHVSALPLEIDPNGELPPLQRQRLEQASRDAMLRIHASVSEIVETADAA
jgi:hypothetical protein